MSINSQRKKNVEDLSFFFWLLKKEHLTLNLYANEYELKTLALFPILLEKINNVILFSLCILLQIKTAIFMCVWALDAVLFKIRKRKYQ